ncbi:MAG: tyrosine-type recombinase/integrase [Candidatus Promineifilaceae bacterium]
MADSKQAHLFSTELLAAGERPPLDGSASIQAAIGAFEQHMEEEGFALNTRKAFVSDIRLMGKYLGIGQPVGAIGTNNLNDFLNWLAYERPVPCSRKSYARRVTALKVFFKWLTESGVLAADPAAAVIQISVSSPLPSLPTPAEIDQALDVSEGRRKGSRQAKPDARPHLLLTLLLGTGIKKSEVMAIVPNHIERDDPNGPILYVRYRSPKYRYKERKIALQDEWLDTLDEYLAQYQPKDTLFTCTARNLEYILDDVAEAAGLDRALFSFENLRWVSALGDFRRGVEGEDIMRRLGLSKITWRETKSKLKRLASDLASA